MNGLTMTVDGAALGCKDGERADRINTARGSRVDPWRRRTADRDGAWTSVSLGHMLGLEHLDGKRGREELMHGENTLEKPRGTDITQDDIGTVGRELERRAE
jgi:hypothetical protein